MYMRPLAVRCSLGEPLTETHDVLERTFLAQRSSVGSGGYARQIKPK